MSLSLFIVIVTGTALGVFIGGTLLKKFKGEDNQQVELIKLHIDTAIGKLKNDFVSALEVAFQSQHQYFTKNREELDEALRHSLQELIVTLQTIKSYSDLDEVKKQEQLEWAINKCTERTARSVEEAGLLLREIVSTLNEQNKILNAPAVKAPAKTTAVKRERKPRATADKKKAATAKTPAEKKPA